MSLFVDCLTSAFAWSLAFMSPFIHYCCVFPFTLVKLFIFYNIGGTKHYIPTSRQERKSCDDRLRYQIIVRMNHFLARHYGDAAQLLRTFCFLFLFFCPQYLGARIWISILSQMTVLEYLMHIRKK